MRGLTGTLETAQQAATRTPYIQLDFKSRNRVTSFSYATTDSPNRILYVRQAEGRFDGLISVPGSPIPISVIVRLADHDNSLITTEMRGYRVDIGWGYNTASGNEVSYGPPVFVIRKRNVSEQGVRFVELYCASLWDMLQFLWATQTTTDHFFWDGTVTVRHILMELLAGAALEGYGADLNPLGAAVLGDYAAGGTQFTDYTVASASIAANDVFLLPAAPIVNDAFYFGFNLPFDKISIDLTQVGAGSWSVTWEYWNGSSWATLFTTTGASIKTFTQGELQIVAFDRPTAWATVNLSTTDPDGTGGDYAATFPNLSLYYIRARVSAYSSITVQPKATRIYAAQDYALALDTAAAAQGDDFQPVYESAVGVDVLEVVRDILSYTRLGIVVQTDGFLLKYIDPAQGTEDYQYDGTHGFLVGDLEQSYALPNRIVYTNIDPGSPATRYTGQANDATSQAAHGVIAVIYVDESITSNQDAIDLADSHLARLQRDLNQGELVVPMNCGQEIWDLVEVVDSRSGETWEGRVSYLSREFSPGEYLLVIGMGGVRRSEMMLSRKDEFSPPLPEWLPLQELQVKEEPSVSVPVGLPIAIPKPVMPEIKPRIEPPLEPPVRHPLPVAKPTPTRELKLRRFVGEANIEFMEKVWKVLILKESWRRLFGGDK